MFLQEKELSDLTEKLHDVENRLHSQLRLAAEENSSLRDEKAHLLAESHTMKKVLKKMKKLIPPDINLSSVNSSRENNLSSQHSMHHTLVRSASELGFSIIIFNQTVARNNE